MILTATEIDNNKNNISKQVDEKLAQYIKQRLSKRLREYKLKQQIDDPNFVISKEIKDIFKHEIESDDETLAYKQQQEEIFKSKSENYFVIRETLQDLNELNEFSADIEKCQIQTIDNFKSFDELCKLSVGYREKYKQYKTIRNQNIDTYISSYKDKKLSFNETQEQLIQTLQEMYSITKDYDDIDLFDKFDMLTNIDISNKLGDICLHTAANGDNENNICNKWTNEYNKKYSPIISKLTKQIMVSNRTLGLLFLTSSGTDRTSFISNNSVTCYTNTYTTTNSNQYTFVTRTLGELLLQIINPKLADLPKEKRQQIYMTYNGCRPTSDMYWTWNGLQVFDIDLKEWEQAQQNVYYVDILKKKLYDELQQFHWFLWICKSASGKGIHIYTKVTPPHHVYSTVADNDYITKYWHQINYTHKASIIYELLYRIHNDTNNTLRFKESDFKENFELKFLDNVVSRITAGIRLTYDRNVLVNPNFIDLQIITGLNGISTDIVFRNTDVNNKLLTRINDLCITDISTDNNDKISEEIDLSKYEFTGDFAKIQTIPRNQINYNIRYNVVNTLASMFGKDGLPLAHKILQSELCKNTKEINSFYTCAISNHKQPSKLGLDILKKIGVIKSIKQEVKSVTDNIFKNGIRKAIIQSLDNTFNKPTFELGPTQYLSNINDELLDANKHGFRNDKINILLSPPGSGKTFWLLNLTRMGKKVLLVEPFTSVIRNKVETDSELMKIFQVFYDDFSLDKLEPGMNAIATFDKFSRCNYEKVSHMFDYICIDESHLLFTSSYRIETTSSAVRKIKELFYISSNDPFSAKLILMTGTETGDTYFFGDVANVIRVSKKSLSKSVEFLICDDSLDAVTRLSTKAVSLINDGYRLIVPTNKGEIYSHKLIGMIEYMLARPVKYGYYKRSNNEQEICRLINQQNTVGDYEIVFCSNYLSVGIDITDKCKFASLYYGPFSGYEVEQFNARIRKTSIKSIYCVQTELSDGSTNDLLIEEPNLVLRLTDEDIENFSDDKQIAKAKQEFIAQYDPVLHKIVTPGFSYLHGAIRFNQEEYELVMFENKFLEVMVHPVKVARELTKYGYTVTVSDEYDGLDAANQEELKKIGLESARTEKIRKHSLLVGTYKALIENNHYTTENGFEYNDSINWIMNHRKDIFEDRDMEEFLKFEYSIFGDPVSVTVKSKEALDLMLAPAKYLINKYSVQRALQLIDQYVDENGILKQKHFKRAINLLKLVDKADNNDLAEPVFKTLEKMYEWLDKFSMNKGYRISYNTYQADVDAWANSYIDMLGITINTTYGFQKIKDNIIEMLNDLATKNTSKDGIRFDYNQLPDADGTMTKYRKSVDTMIENMFKLTSETVASNKKPRQKHIILETQSF